MQGMHFAYKQSIIACGRTEREREREREMEMEREREKVRGRSRVAGENGRQEKESATGAVLC